VDWIWKCDIRKVAIKVKHFMIFSYLKAFERGIAPTRRGPLEKKRTTTSDAIAVVTRYWEIKPSNLDILKIYGRDSV
jgi:hypothetical protein